MQVDDPPYLPVGTAVSAKYKGAFCEAKVSKVVRVVKCKVSFKNGLGNTTVTDDSIKGTLRVGQLVQAKHPDKKEFVDATITKIQDCSQYTVVFDDGDITTLRRTALCLKSGRHFNESETLDQLPLTHPEHFLNPVVGGRRGRRSRQLKEDSSEGEAEEENEPDLEQYSTETGKVVCVETSDKKRSRDNWFPGLVVMPSAQPTVRINVKDEYLVRSFKDGRYYTVPKKEVSDFSRDLATRVESNVLSEAVEKVIKYLDNDELPVHWEKSSLFNIQSQYSDSEENFTDSSDDEPREEKDHFVAQLYKFMDDSGTPLNKSPMINNRDVDLYRLFRIVQKLGGYNRVTNQNKWRAVAIRLKFSNNQNTCNQVKLVYKKCLFSYESFYRTLGCTMLSHPRSAKKSRDRALIRGKDRSTPVQSPRPEKEETESADKKEKEEEEKPKPKKEVKPKVEEKKKKEVVETSDTNSSGETTDQSETPTASKSKKTESKPSAKDKKVKTPIPEKAKPPAEVKNEELKKEEKEDKVQQTRAKAQQPKAKEATSPDRKVRETKTPLRENPVKPSTMAKSTKKSTVEDDKKRGRKRNNDDKSSVSDGSTSESSAAVVTPVNIGDKLKVFYGPTHESKVTYEAKVLEIDKDNGGPIYLVHYTGWNNRYDEWIAPTRIAENLSAATKAKRMKQGTPSSSKNTQQSKLPVKRSRGTSVTGRNSATEVPRSTTPSSVTSSSSRTKSPATPATRNSSRLTRQGELGRRTRRSSVQTDNSIHSDTDSDASESESEAPRTRSGAKMEENENRNVRKRLTKVKGDKRKDDEDTEKEEEIEKPKRTKKLKKLSEIPPEEDSDEEISSPPKGRDFDLNQIRSELKGFAKVKVNPTDTSEKDAMSSDDSTTMLEEKIKEEVVEVEEVETPIESDKPSSSEDIYEFKEPEPFEFESRKSSEEKSKKRLVPRVLEDIDKSPKKKPIKSPIKTEPIKEQPPVEEKKWFKRTPVKKIEEPEIEEKEIEEPKKPIIEDPFDKLVESPSFQIVKTTDKLIENKEKVVKNLNLEEDNDAAFKENPSTTEDECDERADTTDNEDVSSEQAFPSKDEAFSDSNMGPGSPEPFTSESACDEFASKDDRKKDSDDDDPIRESIKRAIAQSSISDDESNDDLLMNQSTSSFCKEPTKPLFTPTPISAVDIVENEVTQDQPPENLDVKPSLPKDNKLATLPKQISPVFQETDSSLLEAMCAIPQIMPKLEDFKDISIKSGPKIADSLLQKLSMIKSKPEEPVQEDVVESIPVPKMDVKQDEFSVVKDEDVSENKGKLESKLKSGDGKSKKVVESKSKTPEVKAKSEIAIKPIETKPKLGEMSIDLKKRSPRSKILSREFIEDSDSDTSDSEERLIIARSDDESQTSFSLDNKPDIKESDSNNSVFKSITDDSQTEEERNFKFDNPIPEPMVADPKPESSFVKEEEPDSHLHSMLYCEETIPGSPAPPPSNTNEEKQKPKSVLEMPFASAPCSSNNKNILINNEPTKPPIKEEDQPMPMEVVEEQRNVPTVLDNTPPTTPESTLSNLSPRDDNGDQSPNIADNESCKSTEPDGEYSNQRSTNMKVSPYSEEDSLMTTETSTKKMREDSQPSPCKKRRRSHKGSLSEDGPPKRGRKPNRSRHNSDSDDTSEHSMQGNTLSSSTNLDSRFSRSPRPRKYNFFVDFENTNYDRNQRIAILQQKIQEVKKCYQEERNELASIEKRRKKIKRRKKENAKAAKQEALCT